MSAFASIKLDQAALRKLDRAAVTALAQTGEYLAKDIKKAQVIPLDTSNLQNDQTFADTSRAAMGEVDIVSSTPYARRLYYNPESQPVSAHMVKEYTRKDGTVVKAHVRNAYTAGKMHFRQEADKDHNRANANAKDHWFEDWEPGGARENAALEAFAKAYRWEAGTG